MTEVECHSPCSDHAAWNEKAGVYVCYTCGRIGDKSCVSETHSGTGGLFTGGQEDEYIRFVGEVTKFASQYHIGPWVMIESPYEAKDVIKSLNEEKTGRMWDSSMNCWLVKKSSKEKAKEQLNNTRFDVIDFTNNE